MIGKPVARLGDKGNHGGQIVTASDKIFANEIPIARVGDTYACKISTHPPNKIINGANGVTEEGQAIAHTGSKTACGATIIEGSPNVFVGDNVAFYSGVTAEKTAKYEEFFVLTDEKGQPVAGIKYRLTTEDGKVVEGVTGNDGKTLLVTTAQPEAVDIQIVLDHLAPYKNKA